MTVTRDDYAPTLAIRASEMNALEQLPGATKDRLRPVFLLAPWVSAINLDKAIDRIEKAYDGRAYILDIDRDYQILGNITNAKSELASLKNPNNAFANWRNFVTRHPFVQPVLQTLEQSAQELTEQIRHYQGINRTFCLRIEKDRFPLNIEEIITTLNNIGTADYCVVIEGGWTQDPLSLSAWFLGVLTESLANLNADIPIVVSCSSMPKGFTDIEGYEFVPFSNRELVSQMRSGSNRRTIVYGDWGSTKPREPSGGSGRPIMRIDYPTRNGWLIARNKDDEWDYRDAATEILSHTDTWNGSLNIWGEQMIAQTAQNPVTGINSPQKNVAARVNIHLHLQAFYDERDLGSLDLDDDWQD